MARFHTSTGKFVGWTRLPNAGVSSTQAVLRKIFGYIPRQPWIPFSARRALAREIKPHWTVWEIGAGFSTLWLGDRVKKLTSIEASKEWFARLQKQIAKERKNTIELRYEWVADAMADFSSVSNDSLDLLFIDGGPRARCLENGFAKVRGGGFIYLDNWDNEIFWPGARDFLEQHQAHILRKQNFIDYVPAQFGVYEGLLVQKAASGLAASSYE